MTYPPQQPGPGGWGQQPPGGVPGSDPQAGPQQQQPAWYGNQHTGWPQGQPAQSPPGLPGPQQQPQQQPPPPPDWGGVQFGQSSWNLEANAFGDIELPKKKSKLPWILGLVGVLVLAGGGATALFFLLGNGPGDPEPVAEDVLGKVNQGDFASVKGQLCGANESELRQQLDQLSSGEFDLTLGQVTEDGDKATAQYSGTYSLNGASDRIDQKMELVVENGEWKVCAFGQ